MTINFTAIEVPVSFDGRKQVFNIAEILGNGMMYNGTIISDIGFEDLAREIYYSKKAVEVPDKYAPYIVQLVCDSTLPATIKRYIRDTLTPKK